MSRVRDFFLREATECLSVLASALGDDAALSDDAAPADDAAVPDLEAAHAAARQLRGSAQMARYGALAEEALALEAALKAVVRDGAAWTVAARERSVRAVAALEEGVEAVREGRMDQDPRRETPMDDQSVEAGEPVVDVATLEYEGESALTRALELRVALEDAIVAEDPVGPILDELFDLIRLGMR